MKKEDFIMAKESLKNKAYNLIKSKIIHCEYAPGTFLNESTLMSEIGSSRTPIREALSKLEQEDLVKILPKKGVMVSDLSMNEINMIFETRILIEPYIVRHYGQFVPAEILLSMKDTFTRNHLQEISSEEIYFKDAQFHKLLIESSKNIYFIHTMERIYNQNYRLRVMAGNRLKDRLIASNSEHREIIGMMLEKKYDAASESMRLHLEKAKEASFANFINTY